MCSSGKSVLTPSFVGVKREKEGDDCSRRAEGGQKETTRSSIIEDIVDDLKNVIINL